MVSSNPRGAELFGGYDRCMFPMSDSEIILTNTARIQRNIFLCVSAGIVIDDKTDPIKTYCTYDIATYCS